MIIQTPVTTNSIDKLEGKSGSKKTGDIVIRNLPPTVIQKVRDRENLESKDFKIFQYFFRKSAHYWIHMIVQ